MRKTSLFILAASIAFIPAVASAQHGPRPGPPAGHSWQGGGTMGGGTWRGGGTVGNGRVGTPARGPNVMMYRHGGPNMHPGHPGPNFRHGRLQRGFVINPFWFGSQFQINNWQMYGFSDPGPGARWVRYYDDAYMIDGGGRVMDTRYGLDWDRYGEDWDMEDGIPAYRGSRDWNPDDEDYDWAESRGGDHGPGNNRRGGHGGHGDHGGGRGGSYSYSYGGQQMGGPMPGPGYGYGYGGGYGYGAYAYPIVIETVTTSGGGYMEEITEEYVQVRQRARTHRRPRCVCAAPRPAPRRPAPRPARPRPPAGERG